MKLRNKKTGEIVELCSKQQFYEDKTHLFLDTKNGRQYYHSLAELNEEWEDYEDYEEPKEYWYIDIDGGIIFDNVEDDTVKVMREIGNYFSSREEAELAVEKLKAIQRLKQYYLKFKLDFVKNKIDFTYRLDGTLHSSVNEQRIIFDDMNLLFGGEE